MVSPDPVLAQDGVLSDFTIDELDSDAARAAFEAEHAEEVEALVAKEQQRRLRKQAKAGQAEIRRRRAGHARPRGRGRR